MTIFVIIYTVTEELCGGTLLSSHLLGKPKWENYKFRTNLSNTVRPQKKKKFQEKCHKTL